MSSIAIGAYFAFTQTTYEDNIFESRARIDHQYFDQKRVEQQLTELLQRQETLEQLTSALTSEAATGTIKPERIASPEATPTEKPTSPINDVVFAPPERAAQTEATPAEKQTPASPDSAIFLGAEREASLQSPALPASATTKHHRIHRAAHHRASLPHRVAPPQATPAEQSPQLTSAVTKPGYGRRRSMAQ